MSEYVKEFSSPRNGNILVTHSDEFRLIRLENERHDNIELDESTFRDIVEWVLYPTEKIAKKI